MKAVFFGILASLLFSTNFILNKSIDMGGGHWAWSASLRFIFMVPILLVIVGFQKEVSRVIKSIMRQPVTWLVWSTIGFGFYYLPLTFATTQGPGWMVAAVFQVTIIIGSLMVPLFNKKNQSKESVPLSSILISIIILAGVFVIQSVYAYEVPFHVVLLVTIPGLIAATAYPLGNRKMMAVIDGELKPLQRTLGMTIASLPFWSIVSIFAGIRSGLPPLNQIVQAVALAILAGVLATMFFFTATELVRHEKHKLATVEATQSFEVMFALLGEMIFLGAAIPGSYSLIGISLITGGVLLHSISNKIIIKRKLRDKHLHSRAP